MGLVVTSYISNFGAHKEHGIEMKETFWRLHDPVNVISIRRDTMLGHVGNAPKLIKQMSGPTIAYNSEGGNVAGVSQETLVRKRFGVTLSFEYSGLWGHFDLSFFIDKIIQGVILLGISVQITKFVAANCFPCDGTSQVHDRPPT